MAGKIKEFPQKLNFFVVGFLSAVSLSLAFEIFKEDDVHDKIDDIAFLVLGIATIFWYRKNANKYSIAPVVLMGLGLVIKIAAVMIEFADKEAVGDDIGIGIALVFAFVITIYQYFKLKKASS